jgi:hypothetical protein
MRSCQQSTDTVVEYEHCTVVHVFRATRFLLFFHLAHASMASLLGGAEAWQERSWKAQVARRVDELIEEDDTAAAIPLLHDAALRIQASCNKVQVWTSGGALPCPLTHPTIPPTSRPTRVDVHSAEDGTAVCGQSTDLRPVPCDIAARKATRSKGEGCGGPSAPAY